MPKFHLLVWNYRLSFAPHHGREEESILCELCLWILEMQHCCRPTCINCQSVSMTFLFLCWIFEVLTFAMGILLSLAFSFKGF